MSDRAPWKARQGKGVRKDVHFALCTPMHSDRRIRQCSWLACTKPWKDLATWLQWLVTIFSRWEVVGSRRLQLQPRWYRVGRCKYTGGKFLWHLARSRRCYEGVQSEERPLPGWRTSSPPSSFECKIAIFSSCERNVDLPCMQWREEQRWSIANYWGRGPARTSSAWKF